MTKELMRDLIFLARKLETATNGDLQVPQDLLDTEFESDDSAALRIKKIKLRKYGFKGTFDIFKG